MRPLRVGSLLGFSVLLANLFVAFVGPLGAQRSEPLKTPLPDETLQLFANEVSGQMAFDNMVKLRGAPGSGDLRSFPGRPTSTSRKRSTAWPRPIASRRSGSTGSRRRYVRLTLWPESFRLTVVAWPGSPPMRPWWPAAADRGSGRTSHLRSGGSPGRPPRSGGGHGCQSREVPGNGGPHVVPPQGSHVGASGQRRSPGCHQL